MALLNYVNGRFVPAKAGRTREYLNPADNSILGVAADSEASDVEDAITAARLAFDEGPWPWTPAAERAGKLFKLADLIESNAAELARLDTLNNGKPLREARFDAAERRVRRVAFASTLGWRPSRRAKLTK